MHKVKSYFLTFLFAAGILWAGYVFIMESGKEVLENEATLEETDYEDTSSNIFYGKIEEDIELFPWNYYPGEDAKKGWDHKDAWENALRPYFLYNLALNEYGELDQAELKDLQDNYLEQLVAYQAGTSVGQLSSVFHAKDSTIMDEIRIVENSVVGPLFFYQDFLELGQAQYQVRIAMGEFNINSFLCAEKRSGKRSKGIWEAGKAKLVDLLEEEETRLEDYYQYMMFVYDLGDIILYGPDGELINCYLESLRYLDDVLLGRASTANILWELVKETGSTANEQEIFDASIIKDKEDSGDYDKGLSASEGGKGEETEAIVGGISMENAEGSGIGTDTAEQGSDDVEVENASQGFSYQIVDLGELILLLMQGENTIGVYYDPISQKFCGYNYFYEY